MSGMKGLFLVFPRGTSLAVGVFFSFFPLIFFPVTGATPVSGTALLALAAPPNTLGRQLHDRTRVIGFLAPKQDIVVHL